MGKHHHRSSSSSSRSSSRSRSRSRSPKESSTNRHHSASKSSEKRLRSNSKHHHKHHHHKHDKTKIEKKIKEEEAKEVFNMLVQQAVPQEESGWWKGTTHNGSVLKELADAEKEKQSSGDWMCQRIGCQAINMNYMDKCKRCGSLKRLGGWRK